MLKTVNVRESVEKEVVRFGNGSIVYTPKRWIGEKVLVVLEEKPADITGGALEILKPDLSSIEGVFLYGSFARNEQTPESDIDLMVISGKKIGLKKQGRFDFLVETRDGFIEKLRKDPHLFLHQIVNEAVPILNEPLLKELRQVKIRPDFREFFDDTLGAFKSTGQLLEIDRKMGRNSLSSAVPVYSLALRLRGLFLIQCFAKKQAFSGKKFKKMLKSHGFGEKEINDFLDIYRAERDNKKIAHGMPLAVAGKLFEAAKMEFLKTEEMAKEWAKANTKKG